MFLIKMIPGLSVFLYSKYSPKCKELVNFISGKIETLQYLCVDNKNIRKKVLNDKKFNVNNVPCILIFFDNGTVEKYEGVNAFKWCEQIVQQNEPQKSFIDDDQLLNNMEEEEEEDDEEEEEVKKYTKQKKKQGEKKSYHKFIRFIRRMKKRMKRMKRRDTDRGSNDFSDFHRSNDTQVNNTRKTGKGKEEISQRPSDEDIFSKDEGLGDGGARSFKYG